MAAAEPLASIRWWWRDWRASTARAALSPLGRLAYLELLFASHGEPDCALPGDDATLAALAGLTPPEWASVSREVRAQFREIPGGRLVNDRMRKEHAKSMRFRAEQRKRAKGRLASMSKEERSENARKAAQARWVTSDVKMLAECQPYAMRANASHPSPSPSPSPDTEAAAEAPPVSPGPPDPSPLKDVLLALPRSSTWTDAAHEAMAAGAHPPDLLPLAISRDPTMRPFEWKRWALTTLGIASKPKDPADHGPKSPDSHGAVPARLANERKRSDATADEYRASGYTSRQAWQEDRKAGALRIGEAAARRKWSIARGAHDAPQA